MPVRSIGAHGSVRPNRVSLEHHRSLGSEPLGCCHGARTRKRPGHGLAPARGGTKPAEQQPAWPDHEALDRSVAELSALPPLVFAGEAQAPNSRRSREVAAGEAFVLQAGDCAESFAEFTADSIRDKLKVILQMAVVLTYGAGVPVVKVGRIAGQFAKPRTARHRARRRARSSRLSVATWSTATSPPPKHGCPTRSGWCRAYHQSASTLNLLRAFTRGGFADLTQVHSWNQQFVAASEQGRRYDAIAAEIDRALRFMAACGIDLAGEANLHQVELFTTHEALVLDYEEALTRKDSLTGDWYDCSAHMVWVGERTRQLEGAHVEFALRDLQPDRRQDRSWRVTRRRRRTVRPARPGTHARAAHPHHENGRITGVSSVLPPILEAVRRSGAPGRLGLRPDARQHLRLGRWPQDAGGSTTSSAELKGFFDAHRQVGTWPGGVHVELTGDDVTECLGGEGDVTEAQLGQRYTTTCDPRLNARQSIDLAFRLAELLRS